MVAEHTEPRVFVFTQRERWAWVYEEDSVRLASNEDFESAEDALASVAIAFPDVQRVEVQAVDGVEETERPGRRRIPIDTRDAIVMVLLCIVLYYLLRRSRKVAAHG
jgi:hypothetical protein